MKNTISNSRALFDLFLVFLVLLLVICLIPLAGRAAPARAKEALKFEDLDIQYSCQAHFDDTDRAVGTLVTVEAPKATLELGGSVSVVLERLQSSELRAHVSISAKPASRVFSMDGRKTLQMALTASGVSMNCLSQRRK